MSSREDITSVSYEEYKDDSILVKCEANIHDDGIVKIVNDIYYRRILIYFENDIILAIPIDRVYNYTLLNYNVEEE